MSRRWLIAVLTLALCGVFAPPSLAAVVAAAPVEERVATVAAAATPSPLPFEPTEELVYEGEFSKLLLRGIEIAEFRFTSSRIDNPAIAPDQAQAAASQLLFKGDATAKGWFRKLFGVDFHFNIETIVDSRSFAVVSTTKIDEQGKRVRLSEAVFDRVNDKVTWTERNPNDPRSTPRVVTSPLNGATHDFISAIYFLRTRQLAVGQTFEIMMSDSGEVFPIPVKVVERKTLKTVLGKKTPTLRVDIEAFGDRRLIQRNGQMTLWITDDARRLPVRARINSDIGTIDIKLKSVVTPNLKSVDKSSKS